MPRPVSWLPRLHQIRQAVAHSVRSHYDRKDVESLFELQPRAAQKLLEMLPVIEVGTARLVDREVLSAFLNEIRDADDSTDYLRKLRLTKPGTGRQKPRSLVRRDTDPASVAFLPSNLQLGRGRMTIAFRTTEELAETMYQIARVLQDDGNAFSAAFEPNKDAPSNAIDSDDSVRLFAELAALEP